MPAKSSGTLLHTIEFDTCTLEDANASRPPPSVSARLPTSVVLTSVGSANAIANTPPPRRARLPWKAQLERRALVKYPAMKPPPQPWIDPVVKLPSKRQPSSFGIAPSAYAPPPPRSAELRSKLQRRTTASEM